MNQLQVFEQRNVLGQELKIYGTQDDPLFLAKDVACWIEHTDMSRMVNLVDGDEKLKRTLYVSGQRREMWFLTEDGMYEVLMQSRKPIAKEFKKKVKNILKEIRKTGRYEEPKSPMEILELQFKVLKETSDRVNTVEKDINHLKEEVKLDAGEYSYVAKKINLAVSEAVKVFSLASTNNVRAELHKDINSGVKKIADIKTRTQLKQKHFNAVIDYIQQWTPSTVTLITVRQLTLEFQEDENHAY